MHKVNTKLIQNLIGPGILTVLAHAGAKRSLQSEGAGRGGCCAHRPQQAVGRRHGERTFMQLLCSYARCVLKLGSKLGSEASTSYVGARNCLLAVGLCLREVMTNALMLHFPLLRRMAAAAKQPIKAVCDSRFARCLLPQIALMGSAFSEDGRLYAYSLASGGSGACHLECIPAQCLEHAWLHSER